MNIKGRMAKNGNGMSIKRKKIDMKGLKNGPSKKFSEA